MHRRRLLAGATLLALSSPALVVDAKKKKVKDKDCSDFKTQKQAQRFFKKQGGPQEDPHRLDGDNDGRACESLP